MSPIRSTLKLGCVDRNARPSETGRYFRKIHEEPMLARDEFRGEKTSHWIPFNQMDGTEVRELQSRLRDFGFYPNSEIDGIFGYETQSSVRLFQENVRNVEEAIKIGTPDGIVGPNTLRALDRWNAEGKQSDWADVSSQNPTAEFQYWMELLNQYRQTNLQQPVNLVVELLNAFDRPADSAKVADWNTDSSEIHVVGIRRPEWRKNQVRRNDDLFVLLVNGLVFKFFGSTDPNPVQAKRPDEAYLIRGQHRYRFGWHKLDYMEKVYRAFRPASHGVLIGRDFDDDDVLDDEDIRKGLQANAAINIHWSGAGTGNWSAGCQVIDGSRYISHLDKKVDCSPYAAGSYKTLPQKTRGAYNLFLDLITAFAPDASIRNGSSILYTLIYDRDFNIPTNAGQTLIASALAALASRFAGEETLLDKIKKTVSIDNLVSRLIADE